MRIVLTALLAESVLVSAQKVCGDPLKYPQRMVDGNAVDLNPLFRWWNKTTPGLVITAKADSRI